MTEYYRCRMNDVITLPESFCPCQGTSLASSRRNFNEIYEHKQLSQSSDVL